MIVYCIRHKATGKLMPAQMFSRASGSTWWEPTDEVRFRPVYDAPRLFLSEIGARRAAAAWEKGTWGRAVGKLGLDPFDPPEPLGVQPGPAAHPRAPGDLEVLRMVLVESPEEKEGSDTA